LADNPLDTAIKGISAIVYVLSIQLDPDPHNVIPQNASAAVNALKAAAKQSSVLRFVQNSSLGAAFMPNSDPSIRLDSNSWNNDTVQLAWAPTPYDWSRTGVIYMASKVEAEKALWKFVEEEKPSYAVKSV
jgi:nucleoside-diphosphate-sugar epimerase